jgi:hypothetical protein
VNGNSVSSLGGSSTVFRVDSNTFNRFESSNPGSMPTTSTSGTVTYNVQTETQVPKGAGSETLTLFAAPANMSSPRRDVQLEAVSYRHGTLGSSSASIIINGNSIGSYTPSANSTFLSSTPELAPNYTSIGGTGGTGWYVTCTVARALSGSLYYSTTSEVQLRYSYEVLQ